VEDDEDQAVRGMIGEERVRDGDVDGGREKLVVGS
jgi:hypothetical protein